MTASNLRTVRQLAAECPAFTEAAIRWHVYRAPENGLTKLGAITRVGRRVLIDREKWDEWVSRGQTGVAA